MTLACNLCTSLEERLVFFDDAADDSSADLLLLSLASKRLGVAATLGVAFVALVLLLLLDSLLVSRASPVLSALLKVEVTVPPLPMFT